MAAEEEQKTPVSLTTHENKVLHSIFSDADLYINIQQIYNLHGLFAHRSYFSNNFKRAISEYKGVLQCDGYDYDEFLDDNLEAPLTEHFFTKRLKTHGFTLYGKLGVDFLSTSELLYRYMKIRPRLIRARLSFYMICDNPNVSLGILDCSPYIRHIAFKDEYHKKPMDMLAYIPEEFNYLKTLAKTFIIPTRQNQFIQGNVFNNPPVRRIALAINTNAAFTG